MRNLLLVPLMACGVTAQIRWESAPPGFERVPGNAAISMPVRWSVGLMQVLFEQSVLPASLTAQPLQRMRLRRPAFAGDPADPARTIDCELRLGDSQLLARQMGWDMPANRPASLTVVAARRTYSVPATPALGAGDAIGADMIDLPLDAPFTFAGPSLFVEWQNYAPNQNVSTGHWTDAVHATGGVDLGGSMTLGSHGCGSRSGTTTMTLTANGSSPPAAGSAFPLLLRQAVPTAPGVLFTFFDPLLRNPLGLSFGQDLTVLGLPGCFLWAGPDIQTPIASDVVGEARASVTLPSSTLLRGRLVAVQALVLDTAANGLGVAASSGVLLRPNFMGVFDRVVTVLDNRPTAGTSLWPPFLGLAPILQLGF
ncbi:MAG: hypothetical protein R3F56_21490 [Planctomycetota bacterium]